MSGSKMNPEVKEKWVAALRSGEYEQGAGRLRSHDSKFCCLGVLYDIAGDGWVKDYTDPEPLYRTAEGLSSLLPDVFRETVGITVIEELRLSVLNDDDRKTFPEIAEWIEENL